MKAERLILPNLPPWHMHSTSIFNPRNYSQSVAKIPMVSFRISAFPASWTQPIGRIRILFTVTTNADYFLEPSPLFLFTCSHRPSPSYLFNIPSIRILLCLASGLFVDCAFVYTTKLPVPGSNHSNACIGVWKQGTARSFSLSSFVNIELFR